MRAAPGTPTARPSSWPSRSVTCRARWSCTPRWPSSPPTGRTGTRCCAPPTPAPSWQSARGSCPSCACPTPCAACCRWRDGQLDRAEQRFREAHALAEQVGWSELSFQSLYGLALVLRDRGAYADAVTVLGRGRGRLRAGRTGRTVRAGDRHAGRGAGAGRTRPTGARVGGRGRGARRARSTTRSARRPPWRHAARRPRTRTKAPPSAGRARSPCGPSWNARSRPPAAACWPASACATHDPARARRLLDAAAAECERLGVAHLAERARALVAG